MRSLILLVVCAGCTSMLGIDDDYVLLETTGNGGTTSTGARPGSSAGTSSLDAQAGEGGGLGFADAAMSDASADAPPIDARTDGNDGADGSGCGVLPGACQSGTKCCSGLCVSPQPLVGCDMNQCDPCPEPPAHGVAVCQKNRCEVECNPGFRLMSGQCMQANPTDGGTRDEDGGAGGGLSAGGQSNSGGAPSCDPTKCDGCGVLGPFGCCRNNDTCGCAWSTFGYCL